jgi:hypothetical protein
MFVFMSGLATLAFGAETVEKVSLRPTEGIRRAELFFAPTVPRPKAVLLLCPGYNGNGEGLIRQREWQEFATKHQLGLAGLSFASDGELLQKGRGYYYPALGSGQLLLDGLRGKFGRDLPILLYGFSGGAHFTSRFAEWRPDRVLAWCAYSAAWWDEPASRRHAPPGLIVCGDEDPSRYGASLLFFKQGRGVGKPWLWLSLPKTGHQASPKLDAFVRDYFRAILSNSSGVWVDVDREEIISTDQALNQPSLSGWLPCRTIHEGWKALHAP